MQHEDQTASGLRWAQLFADGRPRVILDREALVERAIANSWIAISGAPGMGKSTLLQQIADRLRSDSVTVRSYALRSRSPLPPVSDLVAGVSGQVAIIIDDFDWFDIAAGADWLGDTLRSGVRLITASVDSPAWGAPDAALVSEIRASELSFTRAEHARLHELTLGEHFDPFVEGVAWQVTRGGVAGAAFCAERLRHQPIAADTVTAAYSELAAYNFELSLNDLPTDATGKGMLAAARTLRRLPQLSSQLVSTVLGPSAGLAVADLTRQPTLLQPAQGRDGYWEWTIPFWHAFTSSGRDSAELRKELADKLKDERLFIDELWQRILVNDFDRAEYLLGAVYLGAETTIPSVVADHLRRARLADHPLCRALGLLSATGDADQHSVAFRDFARSAYASPKPVQELAVGALQAYLAILAGEHALGEAHLARIFRLWRSMEIHVRHSAPTLMPSIFAARAHLLAGRLSEAHAIYRTLRSRTDLPARDARMATAMMAFFETESHPEISRETLRQDLSALAVDHGVVAAAWWAIGHGAPEAAVDMVTHPERSFADSPLLGFAQATRIIALVMCGRNAEAVGEFSSVHDRHPAAKRHPILMWAGVSAYLAEGRTKEAAAIEQLMPVGNPFTRLALTQVRIGAGVVDTRDRGDGKRCQRRLTVIRSLELTLDAVEQAMRTHNARADRSARRALALGGEPRLSMWLRLIPDATAQQLLEAVLHEERSENGTTDERTRLVTTLRARLERPRDATPHRYLQPLTERELAVLRAIEEDLTLAEIAKLEFVSINTVKSQISAIKRKLGVSGARSKVVEAAIQLGILR